MSLSRVLFPPVKTLDVRQPLTARLPSSRQAEKASERASIDTNDRLQLPEADDRAAQVCKGLRLHEIIHVGT